MSYSNPQNPNHSYLKHNQRHRPPHLKKKKKPKHTVLTEEEAFNIPLVEWIFNYNYNISSQCLLLKHSWTKNDHSTIYQLLKLCKEKDNKQWIKNIRRALYVFKPSDYDISVWNKFHQLFKQNSNAEQYEAASVIILPIIASIASEDNTDESLEKSYKMLTYNIKTMTQKDKNYKGPSLRSIVLLLQICCENMQKGHNTAKSIQIAFDLYKLTTDYKVNIRTTSSTAYFDHLFQIFAFNKTCIQEFNVLFNELIQSDHNKALAESTVNALKTYFKTIDNIEIYENVVSDSNGYLFHDDGKGNTLQNIKLPTFRLSPLQNEEKQLLLNKMRMQKLGKKHNDHRRKREYQEFVKYMTNSNNGGAQVIIDGVNVGHTMQQNCFCFDFIDDIASYYANTKKKKVAIMMPFYRIRNATLCGDERVKKIIQKWRNNEWLVTIADILYDDVLWCIYALHSCLIYDGKVMIITNDEMKDHKSAVNTIMTSNQKRLFEEFLETKLCRIEIFKGEKTLKRKHDFEGDGAIKKQKINANESIIQRKHQKGYNKYEYIHRVFPYKLHEPYPYVIKPHFYQYEIKDNASNTNNKEQKWEELTWFLPQICNTSDCHPENMFKQSYSDWIIQKRIRWIVAKVRRPLKGKKRLKCEEKERKNEEKKKKYTMLNDDDRDRGFSDDFRRSTSRNRGDNFRRNR